MRCPDCNKFASFEEADPEVEDLSAEEGSVTATVRITNMCAECGTELKEATLELESEFELPPDFDGDNEEHAGVNREGLFAVSDEGCERTQRSEGKGRETKTYYGVELHCIVTHPAFPEWEVELTLSDDIQASAMEEMV